MSDNKENYRALVLEDEPIISRILNRALSARGIAVETAENGKAAKEILDSGEKFDVYIFDIRTPVISGIQLYDYIQETFPSEANKVFFMTGDCLNAVTSSFLERVKRPYVNKPFTPDQIIKLVNEILGAKTGTAN